VPTQFELGYLIGLLAGEGHFGGDGRQPQVTLRMHVRHEAIFRWLERTFPGGRVYGPYHHGGRDYFQWMARGSFLREELVPLLDQFLSPSLDSHSFGRFQLMKDRYPQLAEGRSADGEPAGRPTQARQGRLRRGIQSATSDRVTTPEDSPAEHATDDPADLTELFSQLREAWPP
jgi:hypothetical protein